MAFSSAGVEQEPDVARPRVAPSVGVAVAIIALYTAIIFAVGIVTDIDYITIAETTESTWLHYALPTLLASAAVAVVITYLGWWRLTLFDRERSGPRWAWTGPIAFFLLAVTALATLRGDGVSREQVLFGVLGAIGVGFGEEMLFRGGLLVGLRSRFTEEKVWLISTLGFAAFHIPNVLIGMPILGVLLQLPLAFIVGSLLYSIRRLAGSLLPCMFLHGLWDTANLLPEGDKYYFFVIYPIAIVCAAAVILRNRGKRLSVSSVR